MRPQRSNSGPTTPIGPIPTRACVPLSARRCYRGRRAMGRRRRADVPRPCGGHRRHCRPRRPLHRPPRPPERGARCVPKVEPVHACAHRNRHERRPPLPPLPSRGLSPHSTSLTTHPASSAPRPANIRTEPSPIFSPCCRFLRCPICRLLPNNSVASCADKLNVTVKKGLA